jgi:hypothetical protein
VNATLAETDRLVAWLRDIGVHGQLDRRTFANGRIAYDVELKWDNGRTMRTPTETDWSRLEVEIVKTVCLFDDSIRAPDWSS